MLYTNIFRIHFLTILGMVIFLVACQSSSDEQSNEDIKPTAEIEKWFDLSFDTAERDSLLNDLQENLEGYQALHGHSLPNSIPPSLQFNPIPVGFTWNTENETSVYGIPENVDIPENREEMAFFSVAQLSSLIRSKKVTSMELTELYLNRIKKYGDTLKCIVSITEDLAIAQAKRADEEIAAGNYRGPLHGIPYGVKDLLAVPGYKTTWGAEPYKDQVIDETATVVKKLEEAGAVLVAKLSMGALAWGDVWFGGVTKNPWNLEQGSSGSSAGSASATVAGLVAFSIGTETLGSIVSPSTRCGASGLRPSYGRVSRFGAMALSWSMDKIGPICRTIQDCALVFDVIQGEDGVDQTLINAGYSFNANRDLSSLKVGYFKTLFEKGYNRENDSLSLLVLKDLGVNLQPIEFPDNLPVSSLRIILSAEAAAAFDELTRSNRDDELTRQIKNAWPNVFRGSRFIPAVEYINANRVRYQLIQEFNELIAPYDVIVTPTFGGSQLLVTNLTGHPCAVVTNGFNENGSPTSISFIGNLFDEGHIMELAHAFQQATDFEEQHPDFN